MKEKQTEVPQMALCELQRRLIYAIIVAGKSARFTEGAVTRLLDPHSTPFKWLTFLLDTDRLDEALRAARTGNYTKIARAIRELLRAGIDLQTCTPEQLEEIHGIGPKTSRFFILWTRPNERYAALDVHVLRWLRDLGYSAPKSTPTGKRYRRLERLFLKEADKRGMSPRELDAQIWESSSGYTEKSPSFPSGNDESSSAPSGSAEGESGGHEN